MKDFLDTLDDRLRVIAEAQTEARVPSSAAVQGPRRRRPALLAGLTGVLATAGAIFAMNGVSFADLPILETEATDASGVSTMAEPARAAGVDFSKAHAFPTINGPGYVLTTPDDATLCLSVPTSEGEYPGECAPTGDVEENGLLFEIVGDRSVSPSARSLFAFVLPEDASHAKLSGPGATGGAVSITSGVAVGAIREPVQLRWTQDGKARSASFRGPFGGAATTTETCPDGRTVSGPLSVLRPPPGGAIDATALRRACR